MPGDLVTRALVPAGGEPVFDRLRSPVRRLERLGDHRVELMSPCRRALAREPALLFADEPFSALDALTRAEMQGLLVELVQRWHTAALLVTHDIDEAMLVADRILLMAASGPDKPGRIVREWRVDLPRPRSLDIMTSPRFGEMVTRIRGLLQTQGDLE